MGNQWTEADSAQFLSFSDVITPSRREQMSMLVSLIPGEPDEGFQVVELGHGGGEWGALVLSRFTAARYLGLDRSDTMRQSATEKLSPYAARVALQPFALEESTWRRQLPRPLRCVFSSLVVHHLDDAGKRQLYTDSFHALEPGGALLLVDIVQPVLPRARAAVGAAWDALVREQSIAMTGSDTTFKEFKAGGWNCYTDPDPMDMPAPLFEQLRWLADIGYTGVDCFWQRGGHAVYGGYRAPDGP